MGYPLDRHRLKFTLTPESSPGGWDKCGPKERTFSLKKLEAVGVESAGKKLIVNNFKDLRRIFLPCFSFLRELRGHYYPQHCKLKILLQDDPTFCRMVQGSASVSLPR